MHYSVIIPLYNKAPYVKESLQSIVGQTKWPDEVIVVDDKSTDGSAEEVEAFFANAPEAFLRNTRVELVRLPQNGGISVARNAGFDRSAGDVVTFFDADDLYAPDFFERITDLFENFGADLVAMRVKLFPSGIAYPNFGALRHYFEPIGENAWHMLDPMRVVTSHQYVIGVGSNVVIRRKWMEKERFLETVRFYEGIDCWYRHFRQITAVPGTRIVQLQGDYLHVREVQGSASRTKFRHWTDAPFPPLLKRFKRSGYKYDALMRGLQRGLWIVHSFSNMSSFRQKALFVFHFRTEFLCQAVYGFRYAGKQIGVFKRYLNRNKPATKMPEFSSVKPVVSSSTQRVSH
ncbi:MAG TPA: glycosyltransferase family 2 protein [Fluviicola sp.]|nr:glycosyltransferase family 2 protein [Fluviicola sp.]